jgi:hypothetical protein
MGICRFFFQVACYLRGNPEQFTQATLETICRQYQPYAYIGSRKQLVNFILSQSQAVGIDPAQWFSTGNWQKDSGAFPDFVFACEAHNPFGNGVLLELKDSAGAQIASFNSTLPSAQKKISHLTKMVKNAVQYYDSQYGCSCPDDRDCFYLIRTDKKNTEKCRFSVVQGTFFETISNRELLKSLWKKLLEQAGVPTQQHQGILDYLAKLERDEIAKSRVIEGAAVKPRLRIMSEVITEANPHAYKEIGERTINLILKAPSEDSNQTCKDWIIDCFYQENLAVCVLSDTLRVSNGSGCDMECRIFSIKHELNGLHLVVQLQLG